MVKLLFQLQKKQVPSRKKLMVLLLWPTMKLFFKATPGTVKVHNNYTCGHEFWLTVYTEIENAELCIINIDTWFTVLLETIRVVFNYVCSSKLYPKPKWSFWPTTLRAQTVQVTTQIKYVYVWLVWIVGKCVYTKWLSSGFGFTSDWPREWCLF